MFLDNSLAFSTFASPQAITATANSTNILDVTGAGSGNAPAMKWGNAATIGLDWGVGDGEAIPYLYALVTTAGTGAGTITISLQAAADNGSNAPGTYYAIYTSPAFVGTALTLGSGLIVPVPQRVPGQPLPRFYKLVYTVASTATASFASYILINPDTSLTGIKYPANYTVV